MQDELYAKAEMDSQWLADLLESYVPETGKFETLNLESPNLSKVMYIVCYDKAGNDEYVILDLGEPLVTEKRETVLKKLREKAYIDIIVNTMKQVY